MLKNWISVILLCSFLRLQFVCCCEAVGHCDLAAEQSRQDAPVCHHRTQGSCSHSSCHADGEEGKKRGSHAVRCCHQHSKDDSDTRHTTLTNNDILPISPCCKSSESNQSHHHLYLLAHGKLLPSTKFSVSEFTATSTASINSCISTRTFCEGCVGLSHRTCIGSVLLLTMLGRWLI